jgi:hypothetical protein
LLLCACGLPGTLLATPFAHSENHVLLVAGLGGEERYTAEFTDAITSIRTHLIDRHGYDAQHVCVLAEQSPPDRHIDGVSTLENIQQEFDRLQTFVQPGDSFLLIAVGHGQSDYQEPKLNLPGPDLSAQALAMMLDQLPNGEHQNLVLSFPCSGHFSELLARPGRVLLASTDGPRQIYHSVMTDYLVRDLQTDDADVNADGALSFHELFNHLSRQVEGHFTAAGTLQTENPSLEDNSDGKVTTLAEGMDAGDGELSRRAYITPASATFAQDLPAERMDEGPR